MNYTQIPRKNLQEGDVFYLNSLMEAKLQKAKKPELVKFVREVIGEKISASQKKEDFLKIAVDKLTDRKVSKASYVQHFGWDTKDVGTDLSDADIKRAIDILSDKVALLYANMNAEEDTKQKKLIHGDITYNLFLRNLAFVKLVNLGKAKLLGIREFEKEVVVTPPLYVDSVTGERIKPKKYVIFPNMKYCKAPSANQTLDLNNITFLGTCVEKTTTVSHYKNYIISMDDHQFALSNEFDQFFSAEINYQDLPKIEEGSRVLRDVSKISLDEITYRWARFVINLFADEEIEKNNKLKEEKKVRTLENERNRQENLAYGGKKNRKKMQREMQKQMKQLQQRNNPTRKSKPYKKKKNNNNNNNNNTQKQQ